MGDAVATELPDWLIAELRTDHAGETGAVEIYNGILAVSSDPEVIAFSHAHRSTEASHLEEIAALLGSNQHSIFLPVWRALGWITGAMPALFGARAVFATIEAVETFVDRHYQVQIDRLRAEGGASHLIELLDRLRTDEVGHLQDAKARGNGPPGLALRMWILMVGFGSKAAVAVARIL